MGSFEIVKRVCPTTYLVGDPPTRRKRQIWRRFNAHVAQTRPFRSPNETEWRPEDSESDTENEHSAEENDSPNPTQKPNEPVIDSERNPGDQPVTRVGRRTYPPIWRQQDLN